MPVSGRSTDVVPSEEELRACCAADAWLQQVQAARPVPDEQTLLALSDDAVLALDDAGLEQALAAHARIGERRTGSSTEDRWSRTEQAAALSAADTTAARLAEGNARYEERFGHVFLIRAAGRSADELLAALEQRLGNDPETESAVVRHELAEIVRLRLARCLEDGGTR